MKRWLTEPLIHFALIGLVLFGVHSWLTGRAGETDRTIKVSAVDIERLATLWAGQSGRAPTPDDMQLLVADYVREEALVREARRLGLEDGDTIVRRRLAQKMSFLLADQSDPGPPGEDALRAWFADNRARYDLPEQRGFSHIYLSPQKRGPAIDIDAATIRQEVIAGRLDWQAAGDAFMLQRQVSAITLPEALRLYGRDFAEALFALDETEVWSDPVGSAFGLHLVRIDQIVPATAVSFEAVRESVLADYIEAQRLTSNEQAIADLLKGYRVVIEEPGR